MLLASEEQRVRVMCYQESQHISLNRSTVLSVESACVGTTGRVMLPHSGHMLNCNYNLVSVCIYIYIYI